MGAPRQRTNRLFAARLTNARIKEWWKRVRAQHHPPGRRRQRQPEIRPNPRDWTSGHASGDYHLGYLVSVVNMSFSLRPTTLGDATRLAELSGELIEHGLSRRWSARRISDALCDSETAGVVAEDGGAIIGFALMGFDFPQREAHLWLLAVEPTQRFRGLGRALVGWLEKVGRLGGIASFQLEVRADDPGAQAFYQRLGYREVARLSGYYEGKLDALRMLRVPTPLAATPEPPG